MRADLYYRSLDSTQSEYDRLRRLVTSGDRLCVRAETQTSGCGREGSQWCSPLGGLWFSFDLIHPQPVPSFALYVGFCLHELLLSLYGLDELRLKWPNDLYLHSRKLAGILCRHQGSANRYLIGIGINTNNPPDPELERLEAISLSAVIGFPVSNSTLCKLIINRVEKHSALLAEIHTYLRYCDRFLYGRNREAEVTSGNQVFLGSVLGLDESGALLLRSDSGEVTPIVQGSLKLL